jgi:hypothetical protein
MPYFIYNVHPPLRRLEKIAAFDAFKPASERAKALRREADGWEVKVIFADNELQAEDLLSQVREKEPITGDDW